MGQLFSAMAVEGSGSMPLRLMVSMALDPESIERGDIDVGGDRTMSLRLMRDLVTSMKRDMVRLLTGQSGKEEGGVEEGKGINP